ncbi:unnamed protein product [Gongylonema pulchrum]|uniref:Uncharacterized protein n=1 Tax=Gongylonema pulchrum TaxID=637853 RepID=A0A3P7P3U2_9BILA|nr:unnamed protein product [Gongylonema pulchrum]
MVTADSLARLCFFELSQALEPNASHKERQYKCHLEVTEPVYAMTSILDRLVCGDAAGQLSVYTWADVGSFSQSGQLAPICRFSAFPTNISAAPPNEINALAMMNGDRILYAGAMDNAVRLASIERPDKIIATYSGHDEYVNELALQSANVFLSASEDGTVRLWDTRSKDNHIFRVAANEKLRQDSSGRGICALDAEEDFMVRFLVWISKHKFL